MPRDKLTRVALVWPQFMNYHDDRCIALAKRLEGRAQILAVEVASSSAEYPGFPFSGETGGAIKRTLFPGRSFDEVPRWRRFLALLANLRGCRAVFTGIPYSELESVVLVWLLRLTGKQVVLMCDSKFDDFPRSARFELLKSIGLLGFSAVMVPGSRGEDYFRFLGFRRRPVVLGHNTLSVERIREDAGANLDAGAIAFEERDFVYVGRFIPKKNLSLLIEAFARYCELEGPRARRLVLVGSGPLESQLQSEVAAKVPAGRVEFAGFLSGQALSGRLARSLGLVLVSYSEQWGLVINEALAVGLPILVSEAPGARDLLVRNGINGYVVENGTSEGIARAMQRLGADEAQWQQMSHASLGRAWLGDVERFSDSVELLLESKSRLASGRGTADIALIEEFRGARG